MLSQFAARSHPARPPVSIRRCQPPKTTIRSTIIEYPSRVALMRRFADRIAHRLRMRISETGRVRIAVPGENAPIAFLERLGAATLAWENVTFTQTDERFLSTPSQRFSHELMSGPLFKGPAAASEFTPLYNVFADDMNSGKTEASAPKDAMPPLDIAVLCLGAGPALSSLHRRVSGLGGRVVANRAASRQTPVRRFLEARLVLSARVLSVADRHILIIGGDMRAAAEQAIAMGDPAEAPICSILDGATLHYAE